jgi:hypothetical protein
VPLLLLGPPFFQIILFWSTTLLTGITGKQETDDSVWIVRLNPVGVFGGSFLGVSDPSCLSSSSALHFSNYSFHVHHPLTEMTGISLHMQWPLTSQSHGSVSQREQLFFCYESNTRQVFNTPKVYLHDKLFLCHTTPSNIT